MLKAYGIKNTFKVLKWKRFRSKHGHPSAEQIEFILTNSTLPNQKFLNIALQYGLLKFTIDMISNGGSTSKQRVKDILNAIVNNFEKLKSRSTKELT